MEDRMTKLIIARPLGKFDLGDKHGLIHWQRFITAGVIPRPICLVFSPADLQTDKTAPGVFEASHRDSPGPCPKNCADSAGIQMRLYQPAYCLPTKFDAHAGRIMAWEKLSNKTEGAENPRKSSIAEFERVTSITKLVSFHAFGQPTHDHGNAGAIG